MSNYINFDEVVTEEFKFTKSGREYVLQPLSAGAMAKYTNAKANNLTYQNGEVSSFKNAGELKPLLVSLGAFEVTEKGRVAVSINVVNNWPEPMVDKLADEIKRISNIDQPATVEDIDKRIKVLTELRSKLETASTQTEDEQLGNS